MLRRGPLERCGFRVVEESRVSPEESASRLQEIETYLSDPKGRAHWDE